MQSRILIRAVLVIFLSIVLAVVVKNVTYSSVDMVEVVVAEKNIKAFDEFTPANLKIMHVPRKFRDDFLQEAATEAKYVMGGIALKDFHEGEVIMLDDQEISTVYAAVNEFLVTDSMGESDFVPKGFRLETLEMDRSGSVNGRLKAGDFVDVIFTSSSTKTGGSYSRLIITHSQIHRVEENEDGDFFVTLILTPKNAVALASAKRNGVVDLVLNPANFEYEYVSPIFTGAFANEKAVNPNHEVIIRDLISYLYENKNIKSQLPSMFEDTTYDELLTELSNLTLSNEENDELDIVIGGEK